MAVSVGIDLGTTFSAVAIVDPATRQPRIIPNSEGARVTPTVIQFIDGKPVFGSEAQSAFEAGEPGCVTVFKRSMGNEKPYCYIDGEPYIAEQLSALMLGHLKREAEAELGDTIRDAVITVPADFFSPEREATIRAAEAAGIRVKKIIDEPNAAAMAYGITNWRQNANILIYDLGGGTFDVTLTRMAQGGELIPITTKGKPTLGGRDWDLRLETLLRKKFAAQVGQSQGLDDSATATLRGLVEGVKKQLSAMETSKVTATLPGFGTATVTVSRQEFERETADLIEQTGSFCTAVLAEAGVIKRDITDILLIGGSTRMPQVSKYLEKLLGKKPITHINPDEAVALGAAIQATKQDASYSELSVQVVGGKKVADRSHTGLSSRSFVLPSKNLGDAGLISMRETTAHAMGMIAVSPDFTRYINDIIIPANHARPVRVAKAFRFYTSARSANEMEIFVLQGDSEAPLDCNIRYKRVVSGIKHSRENGGQTTIRVQYSYDDNGVINVEARQDAGRVNLPIRIEPVPEDMSMYAMPLNPDDFLRPEPLSIVMALDVSGSMIGTPMDEAKHAMKGFVESMDFSYTRVGVVAVSDNAEAVCKLTGNRRECLAAIDSIKCGQTGGGNSGNPFMLMKSMMAEEDGRRFGLVLADGMWGDRDVAIGAAKQCNQEGIETAAIGFGTANKEFLRSISSSDANAMLVTQSQLSSAFGAIAQSLGGGGKTKRDMKVADVETWDD